MNRRLERSRTKRMISGVCGGVAEYLDVDPTIVRVFFVIAAVFSGGLFVIAYIALLVLMPVAGRPPSDGGRGGGDGPPGEARPLDDERVPAAAEPPRRDTERGRVIIGWVLLGLGVLFLLQEIGALRFLEWDALWSVAWPIALIAIGAFLVLQRMRR